MTNADTRYDHRLQVANGGREDVFDMAWEYGELRESRRAAAPGIGSGTTQAMRVPAALTVSWRTADGRTHAATAPIRGKVPTDMSRHAIVAKIEGDQLRVFLERPNPASPLEPFVSQIYP